MTLEMYAEEREERGLARGRAEGIVEGRAEGIESVALNMIRENKPIDEIRRLTNLSITRLKELVGSFKDENNS